MLAERDGHTLPPGVGITADGTPTMDPSEVLKGCILPFGGYKGASIALMIELLVGPLIGEASSIEAAKRHGSVGGPPQGGELVLAFDPEKFGNANGWGGRRGIFVRQLALHRRTRLPGARRQSHREELAAIRRRRE